MYMPLARAVEKYAIPPWPYEACFDRIVVFSVPEDAAARDTYVAGGSIVKPETRRDADERATPRGVIVSAGLAARDVLYHAGMDLGDMVWVARLSPWRHQVDRDKNGKPIEFLFLRVGDIVGSESLLEAVKDERIVAGRAPTPGGALQFQWTKLGEGGPSYRVDPPSYV